MTSRVREFSECQVVILGAAIPKPAAVVQLQIKLSQLYEITGGGSEIDGGDAITDHV